jgi:ABC-type transport system involved in multi-copper enzyme maturation permease subunit
MTASVTGTAPIVLDVTETAPVPFWRLVHVELRKAYDTRASFWLLATIAIVVVVAEAIALIVTTVNDENIQFGDFTAVAAFLTSVLLPVLGIMLVTTEWTQRSAMVTFTLESRRSRVLVAKLVVGVLLTFATIVLATALGALFTALFGLLNGHADWHYGWNGFFGFIISQNLAMLTGFALASLLLNTAAAIVIFFIYSYVLPGLFALGSELMDWFENVAPWIDFSAAQGRLYELSDMTGEDWAHLVVSGLIWLVVPFLIGLRRILRAEVK